MNYVNPLTEFEDEIYSDDFLTFLFEQFSKPPFENIFVKNLDYLRENSTTIEFKDEWNQNPYRASMDVYGSKFFYKILLLVNGVPSISFFTPAYLNKQLRVVPLNKLTELMKLEGG